MYRGKSFGDAFKRVKNELNMPIMFTEFGADAFNAVTNEKIKKCKRTLWLKTGEKFTKMLPD